MDTADIVQAIRTQRLTPKHLVWRNGMSDWAEIGQVPLFSLIALSAAKSGTSKPPAATAGLVRPTDGVTRTRSVNFFAALLEQPSAQPPAQPEAPSAQLTSDKLDAAPLSSVQPPAKPDAPRSEFTSDKPGAAQLSVQPPAKSEVAIAAPKSQKRVSVPPPKPAASARSGPPPRRGPQTNRAANKILAKPTAEAAAPRVDQVRAKVNSVDSPTAQAANSPLQVSSQALRQAPPEALLPTVIVQPSVPSAELLTSLHPTAISVRPILIRQRRLRTRLFAAAAVVMVGLCVGGRLLNDAHKRQSSVVAAAIVTANVEMARDNQATKSSMPATAESTVTPPQSVEREVTEPAAKQRRATKTARQSSQSPTEPSRPRSTPNEAVTGAQRSSRAPSAAAAAKKPSRALAEAASLKGEATESRSWMSPGF
jgi:hypothetical protein